LELLCNEPVTGLTGGKHKFWAAHEGFHSFFGQTEGAMQKLTSPGIWGLGLLAKSWICYGDEHVKIYRDILVENDD
jgi:hypothetical protein